MPFPNEHRARLQDPKKFDTKTFRRSTGGKLYGKIVVPKTIAIIVAKLKAHNKPKDYPLAQALAFPTKNWTADKAKAWLKTNKVTYIRFEPASKTKSSQAEQFNEDTPADKIPMEAFSFDGQGTVEFAGDDDEKNNIILTLYDGSVIKHWYWGVMAFELKGMKLRKSRIPILFRHDVDNRIGYSTKATFENKFILEGKLLKKSQQAQTIRSEFEDGFPFEASLKFDPDHTTLRSIREGESVQVNGKTLKGPGTIILKTVIKEASVCVFGIQNNCKTVIFEHDENNSNFEKGENIMDDENKIELTAEMLATEYSDVYDEVTTKAKEEAEKAIREEFEKFAETFADDPAFCVEQLKAGKSLTEALAEQNKRLKNPPEKQPDANADKDKKKVDPATQEFSDKDGQAAADKDKSKDEKPTEFMAAVDQRTKQLMLQDTKLTEVSARATAVRFCVGTYPELHKAFLNKQRSDAEGRAAK